MTPDKVDAYFNNVKDEYGNAFDGIFIDVLNIVKTGVCIGYDIDQIKSQVRKENIKVPTSTSFNLDEFVDAVVLKYRMSGVLDDNDSINTCFVCSKSGTELAKVNDVCICLECFAKFLMRFLHLK